MLDALKQGYSKTLSVRYAAIWVLCAVLLSIAGPFDTYELRSFWRSLPYWLGVVVVSSVLGNMMILVAKHLLGRARPWTLDLTATAFLVGTFTPFLYYWTYALLVVDPQNGPQFWEMCIYVAAVGIAVYTVRRLIPGLEDVSYLAFGRDGEFPRLMRRLPEGIPPDILRISSDDHRVEVVTGVGNYRIRMRLADAIDEMDGVEGYCTHRSHWIARSAVIGARRENGRTVIMLRNGDAVPVSRKYRPQLEEVGLV